MATLLLLGVFHVATAANSSPTQAGIIVDLKNGISLELAVAATGSFRISAATKNKKPAQIETPMIAAASKTIPPFTRTNKNGYVGISTDFGAIAIEPATGSFEFHDANGKLITSTPSLVSYSSPSDELPEMNVSTIVSPFGLNCTVSSRSDCGHMGSNQQSCEAKGCCWSPVNPNPNNLPWCFHSGGPPTPPSPAPAPGPTPKRCSKARTGVDVNGGNVLAKLLRKTQAQCCAACGSSVAPGCTGWVWSTNGPDNEGNDCWLLSDVPSTHLNPNRVFGWIGTPPPLPPPPPPQYTFTLGASSGASYYGAGGGAGDSRRLTFTSSNPLVGNTHFYAPLYYSSDGYGALAASDLMYDPNNLPSYPAGWSSQSSAVQWAVKGSRADLYLMPGTHPTAHSSLWDLIGRPAIPPRYAFGFIACRWGWGGDGGGGGRSYIWKTLSAFREGNFPIDAWISDFGWYTAKNDYDLPETGSPTFQDFSYNSEGPEATFPQPVEQLQQYHDTLHMRFGGIRKPRLGNSKLLEMAYSKRWTVGQPSMTGMLGDGGPRNLNYSIEAVRTWYAEQQQHYHSDGVDFWWNDEGEIFYFDFFWWNTAQRDGLHKFNSSKRFWSINRAYTPGISRLGAVIWTGDIPVSWDSLANQPGYVLNWHMAGAGFITCDTGGFNGGDTSGLLLTRWYQYAALMPVMRVHSTKANVPHFPFLYSPDAADAMRKAMNLRYELLPYHYSLAHHAYEEGGIPMMRPLLWYFPSDPKVADMTFQWMDGDKLMAAPVLQQDNSTSVYLPKAQWYEFNSTVVHTGPTTLSLENVPLDHIPIYAQAGAVLPLTSSDIQHTGELPGGPLLLQVYGGADGSFVLVEDDGETLDYTTGAVKRTSFTWSEASRTLSWTTQGTLQGAWSFLSVSVVLFEEAGVHSQTATLTATGHVKF